MTLIMLRSFCILPALRCANRHVSPNSHFQISYPTHAFSALTSRWRRLYDVLAAVGLVSYFARPSPRVPSPIARGLLVDHCIVLGSKLSTRSLHMLEVLEDRRLLSASLVK